MSDYTCAASDFYNQLEQHTQLLAVHMIGAQAGARRTLLAGSRDAYRNAHRSLYVLSMAARVLSSIGEL